MSDDSKVQNALFFPANSATANTIFRGPPQENRREPARVSGSASPGAAPETRRTRLRWRWS
jgi:hypothetical protein